VSVSSTPPGGDCLVGRATLSPSLDDDALNPVSYDYQPSLWVCGGEPLADQPDCHPGDRYPTTDNGWPQWRQGNAGRCIGPGTILSHIPSTFWMSSSRVRALPCRNPKSRTRRNPFGSTCC